MTEIKLQAGERAVLLELLETRDRADYGEPGFTLPLVLAALQTGEFTLSDDTVVAYANGQPLGAVALLPAGSLGFVSPLAEGYGAGSMLLEWVENRAHERSREIHRQRAAATNARAHSLLEARGYTRVREVRHMSVSLQGTPSPSPSPAGIGLRGVDLTADAPALHEADKRMFAENADYEPVPFEVFRDEHLIGYRPDPGLSSIAQRGDRIVGFTLCREIPAGVGHVDLLAIDPGERRQGLGRILLLRALHAFADAGLHEGRLEVASDNPPAIALYGSVGMIAANRTHVFEKPLKLG